MMPKVWQKSWRTLGNKVQNAGKDLNKIKPEKETKPADVRLCVCVFNAQKKNVLQKDELYKACI